jgi:MerR family transcriptional regulator/heat shock protein HspR
MYDREPLYVISVAARILGMHAQTLRKYEREQFIVPSRTQGRLRLYSAEDIERLRQIKSLVERGLNLAGVELALTLTQQLDELRRTVAESSSRDEAIGRCDDTVQELLALLGAPERQARPRAQPPASAANGGRR